MYHLPLYAGPGGYRHVHCFDSVGTKEFLGCNSFSRLGIAIPPTQQLRVDGFYTRAITAEVSPEVRWRMEVALWQSWKFIVFIVLATLLMVWVMTRWRLSALVRQREQLVIEVASQTEHIQSQNTALEKANSELYELSIRDPLTGIFNRRYMFEHGGRELERRRNERMGYALILIDIDFFKKINDAHGHATGDVVLRAMAKVLADRSDPQASIGRVGGEEFLILLGPLTAQAALHKAVALQEGIASLRIMAGDKAVPVTVSMGVTVALSHEKISLE